MRWQLMGDWPVGQYCIPTGTIIEARVSLVGNNIVADAKWNGVPLPLPPPPNVMSLDNEAARMMLQSYPDQRFRLHFAQGVAP